MKRSQTLLVTVAVVLSGSACSIGSEDARSSSADSGPQTAIHVGMVRTFTGLSDAVKESAAVIIGTAGASHVEVIGDVPFTVTDVAVVEAFKGKGVVGDAVQVRQAGSVNVNSPDTSALLQAASRYLRMLDPFQFSDDSVTGQWVVAAEEALWQIKDNGTDEPSFSGPSPP